MEKNKEFSSTHDIDYKKYKEFALGYASTRKFNIVFMLIILFLLILYMFMKSYILVIIFCIVIVIFMFVINGNYKRHYKKMKNLNNGESVKQTVKISDGNIVLTSQKANVSSYKLEQIIEIAETENLFILKFKHNKGITVDKGTLTGGSKEEFIEYLYENCSNLKSKKVVQSKKRIAMIKIFLGIYLLICVLAVIFLLLDNIKMKQYAEMLEDQGYNTYAQNEIRAGANFNIMAATSNNSSVLYVYDLHTENLAKHNLDRWASLESDENMKDEYIVADEADYKKYVIDDFGKYVVLIRKNNYVFYGTSNYFDKDELDDMVSVIDD